MMNLKFAISLPRRNMFQNFANYIKAYYVVFIAGFVMVIFTYSYYDFKYNMSVGVGHAYVAKSLALSGNFDVNEYWGNAGVDVIKWNGHKYLPYAPLNAILMSFFYFLLQVIYYSYLKFFGPINGDLSIFLESTAMRIPTIFFYCLTAVLLQRQLVVFKVNKVVTMATLIGFLFGTIFLNYGVSFFNHIIAAGFIFLGYYLLLYTKKYESSFFPGILTGLAFLTEFPAILFSIPAFFYLFHKCFLLKLGFIKSLKVLVYFYLPIFFCVALLGIYNYYLFGSVFIMGENVLYAQKSLLGTQHSFSQNSLYGFWGLYLSPLKGLLLISPFLIFAFSGFFYFYKENRIKALFGLSYIFLVSFVYSLWPDCFGATPFGPRYLISVIPFLTLWAGIGANKSKMKWAYVVLILYSIYICFANLLDGLPSGKWFGRECNTMKYASLYKANSYVVTIADGNHSFAPFLLQYFFK